MLRIAFKEWAAVCRALAIGQQAIILRKGGIAEQGGTFRPEHDRFWLYPTHFHEQQQQGLKPAALPLLEAVSKDRAPEGAIRLSAFCDVTQVWFADRLEAALAIDAFHVWSEETVRQRFNYRTPGLYVLAVRVRLLFVPLEVPEDPDYAGCKTWVELKQDHPTCGAFDSLTQTEYDAEVENIRAVLS
jgi:hypothetical protein